MSYQYTEQIIIELIESLFSNHNHQASLQLREFQISSDAWNISICLLLRTLPLDARHSLYPHLPNGTKDLLEHITVNVSQNESLQEYIQYFCAQTICTICQSGLNNIIHNFYGTNQNLPLQLLKICKFILEIVWYVYTQKSPSALCEEALSNNNGITTTNKMMGSKLNPVINQLNQAITANIIFLLLHDRKTLNYLPDLTFLQDLLPYINKMPIVIIDILTCLPIEINNKKIALTGNERVLLLHLVLSRTKSVAEIILNLHDEVTGFSLRNCTDASSVHSFDFDSIFLAHFNKNTVLLCSMIMKCLQTWLEAHTKYLCQTGDPISAAKPCFHPNLVAFEEDMVESTAILTLALFYMIKSFKSMLVVPSKEFISKCGISKTPDVHKFYYIAPSNNPNLYLQEEHSFCDNLSNQQLVYLKTTQNPDALIFESLHILLTSSCELLQEVLEFLYSTLFYAPVAETRMYGNTESAPTDNLIKWSNVQPVQAIYNSLLFVNEKFFEPYLDFFAIQLDLVTPDTPSNSYISLLPTSIIKNFTATLEKFSQVFFPAYFFMTHYNVLFECLESQPQASTFGLSNENQFSYVEISRLLYLMVKLLEHPLMEIRLSVIDFWYSFTCHQFVHQQVQMEFFSTQTSDCLNYSEALTDICCPNFLEYVSMEKPSIIVPVLTKVIRTLINLCILPENVLLVDEFNHSHTNETSNCNVYEALGFQTWLKFREACAQTLSNINCTLKQDAITSQAGPYFMENSKTVVPWRELECALFVLSTASFKAKSGLDSYVSSVIEKLVEVPYSQLPKLEYALVTTAASRLMLVTADYIGPCRKIFAQSFQLLSSFIPLFLELSDAFRHDTELTSFSLYAERILIEAITKLATAAAPTIARDISVPESDVTFVVNNLAKFANLQKLSLENRCSFVVAAGSIIECLPVQKLQKFHYLLVKVLHERAVQSVSVATYPLQQNVIEDLSLFFTSLSCVKPIDDIRAPPPSPSAVSLDRSSEFRHPILNVMDEFWPFIEQVLNQFYTTDMVVEAVCHAVAKVFSFCFEHAIRYTIFEKFFVALATSFQKAPTIFHLGAFRTMLGIFGMRTEQPVHEILTNCLITCSELVLDRMQAVGVSQFVSDYPDLVGMTLDCINNSLSSPFFTKRLVQSVVFKNSIKLCINLTPECHHPKVLMTMLLLMSRVSQWFDARDQDTCSRQKNVSKDLYKAAVLECHTLVNQFVDELDLIKKMVFSIIKTVTQTFQGNVQWLGIVGTFLLQLLQSPKYMSAGLFVIRQALMECPYKIVAPSTADAFYMSLADVTTLNHRRICDALKDLADQCEANWQKSQFVDTST